MAKNKHEKQTQKSAQTKKNKLSGQKIVVIVLVTAAAFYFVYNNFIRSETPEVKYYTFKKEGELVFSDSSGTELAKIDIEVADDDYTRQLGLMNRKSMEANQGMLFIFPTEQLQSFWMLNTLFSLDMIFINSEKKIVTIHKNTTPLAQKSYPSSKPSIYVLEVVAGFTDRHNIKEGNNIHWMDIVLREPE
jgi:uncharacterized membrane protein (UPF0127 family)